MNADQSLIARVILAMLVGIASILISNWAWPFRISASRFNCFALALMAASRYVMFTVIFIGLGIKPRGDVPGIYLPQAMAAGMRKVIYRDFGSSYGPLHPYLDAAALKLWDSPLVMFLLAISAEVMAFALFLWLSRRSFIERQVRFAAILYITSAVSLQFVTIDGQDNSLVVLLIACALAFIAQRKPLIAGIAIGLSITLVKFLPLIFLPVFLSMGLSRPRVIGGLALAASLGYAPFIFLHAAVWQPLTGEGALKSAGDVPYVIESLTGITFPGNLWRALLLLSCAAVYGLIFIVGRAVSTHEQRLKLAYLGINAITFVVLLFSQKSWPPYIVLCLYPLCLAIALHRRGKQNVKALFLAAFGTAAVAEHSFWATKLDQASSSQLHQMIFSGQIEGSGFLGLEALLILAYIIIVATVFREIIRMRQTVVSQT